MKLITTTLFVLAGWSQLVAQSKLEIARNEIIDGYQKQSDCVQALIQAERAYYTGRFNEIGTLLSACITNDFDKEQKTEAYKLIALSNIFSRNFDKADSVLLLMLRNNPQYAFNAQDPPEFRKRVENFNVHPLVEVGFSAGLIQPNFNVTQVYDTRLLPSTATYKGKSGYHVSLYGAYYLNKNISAKVGYEWQGYSFTIEDKNDLNTALLTETQRRVQWLTAAGYRFIFKNFSIQLHGGAVYSTLKKANAYLVMDRVQGSGEIDLSFNNLEQRTRHELRPLAELKINLPLKNGWLVSVTTRYEFGISNMTNADNRYNVLDHSVQYEWAEDDFKGRYLVMGLSISKQFYKVKMK